MNVDELIPDEVFHFTKKDTALEYILESGKLRISQFGFTNDPRENREWFFDIKFPSEYNEKNDESRYVIEKNIKKRIFEVITEEWKVLSFVTRVPLDKKVIPSTFREGYVKSRMWAQYGENHKGICLEFDGKKLQDDIQIELAGTCSIFCDYVKYDNVASIRTPFIVDYERIDISTKREVIREQFLENEGRFFFTKAQEWESENEFRWVIHSTRNEPEYVNIANSLKQVIVGIDFPKAYEASLISLCEKYNVPICRMYWSNGRHY